MTIEEIKTELVSNVKEFITTTGKQAVIKWVIDTGLPAVKEVAEAFTTKLKEDAETETGWNKFRDSIFLPGLISVVLYFVEKLAEQMVDDDDADEAEAETAAE